jgi:hypothetical protein
VLRLVDLTERGLDMEDAQNRSREIFVNATNSPLKAVDDPRFLLQAFSLGLLSAEEYAEAMKPAVTPTTTPTKKSTLVF